jgi:DNA-binding PadR family transcriptional regulator
MIADMPARRRSNPLALAVLTCLYERPMHPYEMAQTMRSRAKHESVRLNYGSLYGVVESLEGQALIRAVETFREGRRPPRTVYEITDSGRTEMYDWLSELLSVPIKEFPQYEAALSFLPGVPPDEAARLLRLRCETIEVRLDQMQAAHDTETKRGLPRLFAIESEYEMALLQAELEFTRSLIADIESGSLSGVDDWRSWYEQGLVPPGHDAPDPPPPTSPDTDDIKE